MCRGGGSPGPCALTWCFVPFNPFRNSSGVAYTDTSPIWPAASYGAMTLIRGAAPGDRCYRTDIEKMYRLDNFGRWKPIDIPAGAKITVIDSQVFVDFNQQPAAASRSGRTQRMTLEDMMNGARKEPLLPPGDADFIPQDMSPFAPLSDKSAAKLSVPAEPKATKVFIPEPGKRKLVIE